MKYLLMIVLLFSSNQAAAAQFFMPGSEILERCEAYLSKRDASGNTCFGFVTGVADAHNNFTEWGKMSPLWCQPDNIGTGQLIRIVTKYLQEHPESLHNQAASLVANALVLAFSCE